MVQKRPTLHDLTPVEHLKIDLTPVQRTLSIGIALATKEQETAGWRARHRGCSEEETEKI